MVYLSDTPTVYGQLVRVYPGHTEVVYDGLFLNMAQAKDECYGVACSLGYLDVTERYYHLVRNKNP